MIMTGHKPLCYTFNASYDRYSLCEARQMGYISQFTTDIQFTKGYSNIVVSALSWEDINTVVQNKILTWTMKN